VLIEEVAGQLTPKQREQAIDGLLELGTAVDALLADQVEMDIDALEAITNRCFTDDERDKIRTHQRRSYRWTFLVSGLEHPMFTQIVGELTSDGSAKIAGVAEALAA